MRTRAHALTNLLGTMDSPEDAYTSMKESLIAKNPGKEVAVASFMDAALADARADIAWHDFNLEHVWVQSRARRVACGTERDRRISHLDAIKQALDTMELTGVRMVVLPPDTYGSTAEAEIEKLIKEINTINEAAGFKLELHGLDTYQGGLYVTCMALHSTASRAALTNRRNNERRAIDLSFVVCILCFALFIGAIQLITWLFQGPEALAQQAIKQAIEACASDCESKCALLVPSSTGYQCVLQPHCARQ